MTEALLRSLLPCDFIQEKDHRCKTACFTTIQYSSETRCTVMHNCRPGRQFEAQAAQRSDKLWSLQKYVHPSTPQNQTGSLSPKKSSCSRPSLSCVTDRRDCGRAKMAELLHDQRLSLSEPRWDPLHPQLSGLTTKLTCRIEVWLTVFSMDDVPI